MLNKFIVDKTYNVSVGNKIVEGCRYIVTRRTPIAIWIIRAGASYKDAIPREIHVGGSGKNPSEYIYPEGIWPFAPTLWAKDILTKGALQ